MNLGIIKMRKVNLTCDVTVEQVNEFLNVRGYSCRYDDVNGDILIHKIYDGEHRLVKIVTTIKQLVTFANAYL